MSSYGNEYDYAKQFAGNLRAQSQPVPVRVETRLRTNTDLTAHDIQEYKSLGFDIPPRYIVEENPPHLPGLKLSAVARPYFTW
jgi:hypothetical protein